MGEGQEWVGDTWPLVLWMPWRKNEAGFEIGEKYGGVEMTTLDIGIFPLSQPSYGGAADPSLETWNLFYWG